jgi:hypothetical protein
MHYRRNRLQPASFIFSPACLTWPMPCSSLPLTANPGRLEILPAASLALPLSTWTLLAILFWKPIAKHSFHRASPGTLRYSGYPALTSLNLTRGRWQ